MGYLKHCLVYFELPVVISRAIQVLCVHVYSQYLPRTMLSVVATSLMEHTYTWQRQYLPKYLKVNDGGVPLLSYWHCEAKCETPHWHTGGFSLP